MHMCLNTHTQLKQTWSFQTSTPKCRVKRAVSVISCQSVGILLIGIKEVQLGGGGSLIHQTGFELRNGTQRLSKRERELTNTHINIVKLWLFSRSTHSFFPSPKHTFLPGNPATSHLSITIQPSYLCSYKRKLWSLTTCKKMRTATKRLVTKSKTRGGIKKSARKRVPVKVLLNITQNFLILQKSSSHRASTSVPDCLTEKQIWVILPFKNACSPVLFIFRLHANSKHRHEKDYFLVWIKSTVKPNQNHRLMMAFYQSNEPTWTNRWGTWSDNP